MFILIACLSAWRIPPSPLPPILSNLTITPEEIELGYNATIDLDIENIDNAAAHHHAEPREGIGALPTILAPTD